MCGKSMTFRKGLFQFSVGAALESAAPKLSLTAALAAVVYDRYDCRDMTDSRYCQRCGTQRLRTWLELTDDEREVVRRLPASADYSFEERKARHRWCTRCWYEDT